MFCVPFKSVIVNFVSKSTVQAVWNHISNGKSTGLATIKYKIRRLSMTSSNRNAAEYRNGTKLNSLDTLSITKWLDLFDNFLFDCDGVLWLQEHKIEGSPAFIQLLNERNKNVYFVTNNSRRNKDQIAAKAQKMGFQVEKDRVICPSILAVEYLRKIGFAKKVFVTARNGVGEELERAGFQVCGMEPDPEWDRSTLSELELDADVGAVLVSFDEHLSYRKMTLATSYLCRDPNCLFLASNMDARFPTTNKQLAFPGTGSIVKLIETASNRTATVLGKPDRFVCELVRARYDLKPERTLMTGDRLDTDIEFGKRCGFKTLLVLSGISTEKDVERMQKSDPDKTLVPDFYVNRLGSILEIMKSQN